MPTVTSSDATQDVALEPQPTTARDSETTNASDPPRQSESNDLLEVHDVTKSTGEKPPRLSESSEAYDGDGAHEVRSRYSVSMVDFEVNQKNSQH